MAVITSIFDIKNLGDKITCKYTATSGAFGAFSELGTTTSSSISSTSSPTPNGSFYWIYVGKDYLGRKKFIADRNIQNSISWDTLNSLGICSGKIIDLGLGNKYLSSIRLLTGGISSTDIDNEWDKIIVNSTLGGYITAGDNSVWNWNGIYSWTSTSKYDITSYKYIRGSTVAGRSSSQTSGVSTTCGFRPVLLVEQIINYKYLIKQNNNYYTIKTGTYDFTTSHNFTPLSLTGGTIPNKSDIDNFGFTDLNILTNSMSVGSDTFLPIDKLNNQFDIKMYKP